MSATNSISIPQAKFSTQFPFAAAPDIIRSNQKDAFFQAALSDDISAFLRNMYGARFVNRYASEVRTFGDLLYHGCTTLMGNRTLGEEYCDIVQIETHSFDLPSLVKRASFIVSSVLLPYILTKGLPKFRASMKKKIESLDKSGWNYSTRGKLTVWLQHYLAENLPSLTSPAPVYAVGLAVFYFSGAYYHLSKRALGLRYLFTKRVEPSDQRIGYEVLGVLLVLQLIVQTWLHIQHTYTDGSISISNTDSVMGSTAVLQGGVEMGLGFPRTNNILLEQSSPHTDRNSIESHTATPILWKPRYALSEQDTMNWMESPQQRKCTLCLEELNDPSVATCGHVFCWSCISDWIKEKPECPLCRQNVLVQHILPLRE